MDSKNDKDDDTNSEADNSGVDARVLMCFLEVGLKGVLELEITEKDCTFLVNVINDENKRKSITYENFVEFLLPKSTNKIPSGLLDKVR
jgi:hypothetical protein